MTKYNNKCYTTNMICDYYMCNKEVVYPKRRFCSDSCKRNYHTLMWRRKVKAKAVEYKGGKCQICGYNKSVYSMDFHHENGEDKSFNISTISTSAWSKIKKELDKCILVCKNCHGEISEREYFLKFKRVRSQSMSP